MEHSSKTMLGGSLLKAVPSSVADVFRGSAATGYGLGQDFIAGNVTRRCALFLLHYLKTSWLLVVVQFQFYRQ